jgi:hypothetical protein
MSLAFKEAKLGLADSGTVADALVITDITKPTNAQVAYAANIPYTPKTSTCNEIKVKRAAGMVDLNFTNLDAVDPHTIKYEIWVDGVKVIDRSTGFEILQGGTLAKSELIYQVDPADAVLNVAIYLWADEASQVRLDDHRVRAGIGSEQEIKCLEIEKEYMQGLYLHCTVVGMGSAAYLLNAHYSGVKIAGANTELAISQMLPYTDLVLNPSSGDFIYLDGISLV